MSTLNTTDIESVGASINNFIESVTSALSQTEAPIEAIEAVEREGENLQAAVEELESKISQQSSDIDHTNKRLAETNSRVSSLEEAESHEEGDDGNETPTPNSSRNTPLERICAIDEPVVDQELTANQKRARQIAKDVTDYGKSVPKGIAVSSADIKKVLSAIENRSIHTQTVTRVMNFIDEFGKDETTVKKTRAGRKVVVFTESLVDSITTVVMEHEGSDVMIGT